MSNLDLLKMICRLLDQKKPRADHKKYEEQIAFVPDRPWHDQRYAIDLTKIKTRLRWTSTINVHDGLNETIDWYLCSQEWTKSVSGDYRQERLGLIFPDKSDG